MDIFSKPHKKVDGVLVFGNDRKDEWGEKKSLALGEESFAEFIPEGTYELGLEVGAGTGRCTRAFANACRTLYAQDTSIVGLKELLNKKLDNVIAVRTEGVALPFKNSVFDFEASITVLEHIPPDVYPYWLSECYRVLKPGGIFIVQNDALMYRVLEKSHYYPKPPSPHHVNMITPRRMKKDLRTAGFEVINEAHYPFHRLWGRRLPLDDIFATKGLVVCRKPIARP